MSTGSTWSYRKLKQKISKWQGFNGKNIAKEVFAVNSYEIPALPCL